MLTTRDNKVYVGFALDLPPLNAVAFEYIRILPIWSGYRRTVNREVTMTTRYDAKVSETIAKDDDLTIFLKVIPFREIVSANMYVHGTFAIPSESQPNETDSQNEAPEPAPNVKPQN
jgi:hypothetical protein